jgi:hypothetical protein
VYVSDTNHPPLRTHVSTSYLVLIQRPGERNLKPAHVSDMNLPPLGAHMSTSYPVSIRRPGSVRVEYEVLRAHHLCLITEVQSKNYVPSGHISSKKTKDPILLFITSLDIH